MPFSVTSTVRKIDAHRSGELTPIPSIPSTLMAIVSRMMARNPADRYQTADEVVLAMESFLTPGATFFAHPIRADARLESKKIGPATPMGIAKPWLALACTSVVILTVLAVRFAIDRGGTDNRTEVAVQSEPSGDGAAKKGQAHADFKHRLIGHTALVRYALFSADSQQLFTGGDDGTVCIWDVASGKLLGKLDHCDSSGKTVRIIGLALADHASKLVTSQDDRVRLWDIASRTEITRAFDVVLPDQLQHISSNSDGTQVAAGSVSGNIRVWDITSRQLICESPAPSEEPNYSVAWIPGRSELLVADAAYLEILKVPTGERRVLFTNTNSYCHAAVSKDGVTLAGICFSTEVTLLDGSSGACKGEFWSGAVRIQFLPDGRLVTTNSSRNTDIWDSNGKTRLASFLGGPGEAAPLAVSPDGRFIASAGDDNSILIWNVPDTSLLNN